MNTEKLSILIKRWLPAVLIAMFIFWLSTQTGTELKAVGLGGSEVHIAGHFWMYFFLSIAFYRGTKKPWLSILLCFLYALTDEFHQSFTPGRSASLFDITNDTIAASVAGLILWKFYPKLPNRLKNWLNA